MRGLRLWLMFVSTALAIWTTLIISLDIDLAALYARWWTAAVTMVGGSFIAGASAEGGGAIAFPVFTLLLKIPPDSARNFSFMIQSFGMVSASMLILGRGIPIEPRAVLIPGVAGIIGMILGTYIIAPYLEPVTTKLFFVSLWMAFGIGLWRINRKAHRVVLDLLPDTLAMRDVMILATAGLLGGMVTAIFGNGIDIMTFCVLTLWYGMSEKVATPTSVVLMSVLTVSGTMFHGLALHDIGPIESQAWLAAAPVALLSAPLGAWVASKLKRLQIAKLLQLIIVAQFVGAILVLGPSWDHLLLCLAVVVAGTVAMIRIDRTGRGTAQTGR